MESFQFRECSPKDWHSLMQISKNTFLAAFGHQNDPEDMAAYVAKAFSEENIKKELTTEGSFFYFVELDEVVIGYFKMNIGAAQNEAIEDGLEIERIYLLEAYQGIGVGQLMINKIFELARAMNKSELWLGVWNQNYGALRFYERNGFKKFGEHDFLLGSDLQRDDLMKLSLK